MDVKGVEVDVKRAEVAGKGVKVVVNMRRRTKGTKGRVRILPKSLPIKNGHSPVTSPAALAADFCSRVCL